MSIHRRSWSHRRRVLAGKIEYLLRAWMPVPLTGDQGYADAQVLDTVAEGILDGQLTVAEVDGTLSVTGGDGKCTFTAQGTPAWGDQGVYSQAITRALGRGLFGTANFDQTNKRCIYLLWTDAAGVGLNDWVYGLFGDTTSDLQMLVYDGAGNLLESADLVTRSSGTDYQFAIVLGGYDVNGVPWRTGETAANYLYGAAFFVKGGAFASWTLLWRTKAINIATLYAGFSNRDSTGTLAQFRVPDYDLSAVLQPTALSTFTAPNGTSLDAITPEVGPVWVEQSGDWDIQGNRAHMTNNPLNRQVSTVVVGESDVMIDAVYNAGANGNIAGLAGRWADDDNFWLIGITPFADQIRIVERSGGGNAIRASAAFVCAPGTDYDIRTALYGPTIDAFVDGGTKITYGAAALNENVQVHGVLAANIDDEFDNFAVFARTSAVYESEFGKV